MLSISPIGSSRQAVSYYSNLGKEDYYLKGGEPAGKWWGRGAAALGLGGLVGAEEFRNVLLGMSPDGTQKLVQNASDKKRRAAFDLTYSVPKSVSAAWSQADLPMRKRIEAAGERSLYRVLELFDSECGQTRRGHRGEKTERAGLIGAIFRHDTARGLPGETPDAQLHWHVVIANAVTRADSSTGAFDARPLFRRDMKMALGALFRAELSKELETLGLLGYRPEKERGEGVASWFELDAVPKQLVQEMSKRRTEIQKWLRKRGLSGAKLAEKAAVNTRREKDDWTRDDLFREWAKVGKTHGFTRAELEQYLAETQRPVREPRIESDGALERALVRITEDRARFSRTTLLRYAAEESQTRGAGIGDVIRAVDDAIESSPDIVRLEESEGDTNLTTSEMYYEIEEPMLNAAAALATEQRKRVGASDVAAVIREYDTIRAEQREAVRHVTTGSDIACVVGIAGAGKTYALSVARECWERAGLTVVGTTLAAKASQVLEAGSGIESVHIHRLMDDLRRDKRSMPDVLVVDEAGMVDSRTMKTLVDLAANVRTKLVLVGDHRQLQAIRAGAPFRGIAERIGCSELIEIVRQRELWQRDAVREFRDGDALSALAKYQERGLLFIGDDREDAMEQLAHDWAAVPAEDRLETYIFASTNYEVETLNRLCQRERMLSGELSFDRLTVGAYDFHVGDRVMFRKNNAALLLRNGSVGDIIGVNEEAESLRVRLDDGYQVEIDVKHYTDVHLGYAMTGHKGQGITAKQYAFVLTGGPMTDREMSYVQGSRGAGVTKIYSDILSGGDTIGELAAQMSKSRAKSLAHDFSLELV